MNNLTDDDMNIIPFKTFQPIQVNQDYNPICRGCKQPYNTHIGEEKICPWPAEYPKPDQTTQESKE